MNRFNLFHAAAFAFFAALPAAMAEAPAANLETFEKSIEPLLSKYCVQCHGPDKAKAELRLDELDPDLFKGDDAEHWEEVYNQINIGEMPPEDEEQPTPDEREAISAWLSDELRAAAAMKRSTGGSNVIRRLTRYEYNNTLRDLLGIDLDFAKDLPPEGAAEEGFVNNSSVLGTSGLHLEYFQRIASAAVRNALVPGERPEPFVLEVEPEHHVPKPVLQPAGGKKKKKKSPKGPVTVAHSLGADSGVLLPWSMPAPRGSKKAGAEGALIQLLMSELPQEGPIRVTVRASAVNASDSANARLHLEMGYDGGNSASPFEVLASVDVADESRKDYVFDVRAENFPLTTPAASKKQFIRIRNAFNPGTSDLPPEKAPGLIIDSIRIEAPYHPVWPPETRSRILGNAEESEQGAREILRRFMSRAYRRPPADEEVDRMLALYRTLRSRELGHEDALVETLSAVLASPGFLLLAEPAATGGEAGKTRPLDNYELASRLSYFLWSTMPDETLFTLATNGELSAQFPIPNSQFPIPNSRFPIPMKPWNINRRTLLRGAGTCLALPWLEGMSWAADAAVSKPRLAFSFFPFGVPMPPDDHPLREKFGWFPTGEGADFQFTEAHRGLEPFRKKLTYFAGLSHPLGRRVPGHKAGDVYLTGADISGSAYRQSVSVDQMAANAVGEQTRYPSLVLSTSGGVNRPYRSFTLSYDRDGRPVPAQNNPSEIFRRLFGEQGGDQRKRLANNASVLDTIMDEAKSLNRRLGKRDQEKMDEYLSSVREVEERVGRAQEWLDIPKPVVDPNSLNLDVDPSGPRDYMRTMYDLIVLAFQTDSTRVATYQMASEEGNDIAATFPHAVGINKTSHAVSHARTDYEQWSTYNQFLTEQYVYFLSRLDSIEDADGGTLLDNTMTMLGCCTSQTHVSRNYPLIFSGGGNLGFQHGQYRRYDENKVPLSNLFVTMLDRMGTGAERFKDSNGALTELLKG